MLQILLMVKWICQNQIDIFLKKKHMENIDIFYAMMEILLLLVRELKLNI